MCLERGDTSVGSSSGLDDIGFDSGRGEKFYSSCVQTRFRIQRAHFLMPTEGATSREKAAGLN